jgi:hypothetical protein
MLKEFEQNQNATHYRQFHLRVALLFGSEKDDHALGENPWEMIWTMVMECFVSHVRLEQFRYY